MDPEGESVLDALADAVVGRAGVDAGVGAPHGRQVQLGAGGGRGRQAAPGLRRLREGGVQSLKMSVVSISDLMH